MPVRLTYDNKYFNDTYEGIPIGGYTQIVEKMLDHENIDVETNVDFFVNKEQYLKDFPKIVFTGMIDEFFDYKLGELEYRSLHFENETLDMENYQGNAVVNYTDADTSYIRIIEHKHFEFGNQANNNHLYKSYKKLADEQGNVIFGGRLGHYRYYDMHQVIAAALQCVRNELD